MVGPQEEVLAVESVPGTTILTKAMILKYKEQGLLGLLLLIIILRNDQYLSEAPRIFLSKSFLNFVGNSFNSEDQITAKSL